MKRGLVDLELTRFDKAKAYWTRMGWAPRAPIKTESRIDVPRDNQHILAAPTKIVPSERTRPAFITASAPQNEPAPIAVSSSASQLIPLTSDSPASAGSSALAGPATTNTVPEMVRIHTRTGFART